MAAHFPVIPNEVVGLIMEEVNSVRDTPTLLACALVNKQFLHLSQPHIFHCVKLSFESTGIWRQEPSETTYVMFYIALDSNPKLAEYVRELRLVFDTWSSIYYHDYPAHFMDVAEKMTRLKVLHIRFGDRHDSEGTTSWNNYRLREDTERSFKRAIFTLFRLNTLTEVSMMGIFDLPQSFIKLLLVCPTVDLGECGFSSVQCVDDSDSSLNAGTLQATTTTKTLTLQENVKNVHLLLNQLTNHTLEQLIVNTCSMLLVKPAQMLIGAHSNSLTLLVVNFEDYIGPPFDISNITNLQTFGMRIFLYQIHPLACAIKTLSTASVKNKITEIAFFVRCTEVDYMNNIPKSEWEELDSLLSESGKFKHLQRFSIGLRGNEEICGSVEEHDFTLSIVGGLLPVTYKRGVIDVGASGDDMYNIW